MTQLGGAAMLEYIVWDVSSTMEKCEFFRRKKRRIAMGRIGIAMGTSVIRVQVNTNI